MKKLHCLLASLLLLGATALSASENMVPLRTELPRPKLAGTPVAIKVANLETAADLAARPPVQVAEGSTNVAAGKTVTASDEYPIIGMLEQITDGDKSSDEGFYVEFGDGLQWVQIDLEQPITIYAIAVWHFHSEHRAYNDVVVQISDDAEFKTGVTTVFNNDGDNSSGLGAGKDKVYVDTNRGRIIGVNGVKGRYVRLYSNGNSSNSGNHYIEVEVWGK